nr:hypothetical protein [Tanacetum cinerariifolium]
ASFLNDKKALDYDNSDPVPQLQNVLPPAGNKCNKRCEDVYLKHAVAIALAQKNKGSFKAESIVRAASTRVMFRLSTTSFCLGVRGVKV